MNDDICEEEKIWCNIAEISYTTSQKFKYTDDVVSHIEDAIDSSIAFAIKNDLKNISLFASSKADIRNIIGGASEGIYFYDDVFAPAEAGWDSFFAFFIHKNQRFYCKVSWGCDVAQGSESKVTLYKFPLRSPFPRYEDAEIFEESAWDV
jgi:hypothetical protein